MKEVTRWDNKPRFMWVWDDNEDIKCKEYVICILTEEEMNEVGASYPVRTFDGNYLHCAEIAEEQKKETRLTYYELSQLLKCFGVEFCDVGLYLYNDKMYKIEDENEEVPKDHKIRYKQGEWKPATRETVWEWWGEETPDSDIARFVSFISLGLR